MFLINCNKLNEAENLDAPFTCENLHLFIGSEQLWEFVSEKIASIGSKLKNSEEVERSLWEIKKELNFIQSQFDLEDMEAFL